MKKIKREFYSPQDAAELIDISLSDLWHLIEIGRIKASIRRNIVNSNIGLNDEITVGDYIEELFTFLIPSEIALEIASKGKAVTNKALIRLAHPREIKAIDMESGGEVIFLSDASDIGLDGEFEITRDDLVITQSDIDSYLRQHNKLDEIKNWTPEKAALVEKELSTIERNSMLRIIAALAVGGYKYPAHGSKAEMFADFDRHGISVDEKTLTKYLKQAEQFLPPS